MKGMNSHLQGFGVVAITLAVLAYFAEELVGVNALPFVFQFGIVSIFSITMISLDDIASGDDIVFTMISDFLPEKELIKGINSRFLWKVVSVSVSSVMIGVLTYWVSGAVSEFWSDPSLLFVILILFSGLLVWIYSDSKDNVVVICLSVWVALTGLLSYEGILRFTGVVSFSFGSGVISLVFSYIYTSDNEE